MNPDAVPPDSNEAFAYVGNELDVFKHAHNWKQYWSACIRPYVRGTVLDVGAGLGANSPYLLNAAVTRLVRLEPDAQFVARLDREATEPADGRGSGAVIENRMGTIGSLGHGERFDAILYLDVLEHIEDDRSEVSVAASHLNSDGALVVLAPAFQFLYSPFDKAIGHHRRYTRRTLAALTPSGFSLEVSRYLDAPGALLSAGNRLLLKHSSPTVDQIRFWDRRVIPLATLVDPLARAFFGRSVLCIWRKQNA